MTLPRLGHVSLCCRDLARSLAFYRDVLGFPEAFRMYRQDGTISLVYLHIDRTSYIELMPAALLSCDPAPQRTGYDHLCLVYTDLRLALKELSQRGLAIDHEPEIRPDGNLKYWTTDPDGNRIELTQILSDSRQVQAEAHWDEMEARHSLHPEGALRD